MATCRNSAPMPLTPSRRSPVTRCEGRFMRTRRLISRCSRSPSSRVLIAVGWQLRLDMADAVQLQPPQHAADRGLAQPEPVRDPHAGPALPPQLLDLHDPLLRRAARRTMRTRTPVVQPGNAMVPIPTDPLGCALPAEPELGRGLLQAQPAL